MAVHAEGLLERARIFPTLAAALAEERDTLEDVIEEIIGSVEDEFEKEAPLFLADTMTAGRIARRRARRANRRWRSDQSRRECNPCAVDCT